MAAYSALLRGARKVFVVDRVAERLQKAQEIGAMPINFAEGDPVEQIHDQTEGMGTDKGIDAVGYQASAGGGTDREEPATVLNSLIRTVRATGMLGIPGLYVPSDPGAPDEAAKQGMLMVAVGKLFEKGLKLGTGQCNVKRYNRQLRDMIIEGGPSPASWSRTNCRWTRRRRRTTSSTSGSRDTPRWCCTRRTAVGALRGGGGRTGPSPPPGRRPRRRPRRVRRRRPPPARCPARRGAAARRCRGGCRGRGCPGPGCRGRP